MASFAPFQARPLVDADRAHALSLAQEVGLHGVYLRNDLSAGIGEAIGLHGQDDLLGCIWFGPRGNMVVIEREPLDPYRVAEAVESAQWPWRIALGPAAALNLLADRLPAPPLVLRDQVYYGCRPEDAQPLDGSLEVRPAQRGDRERLVDAALDLHHLDLNIRPDRVDRRWLREAVTARIADGTCLVLGPVGGFHSKLDLGSRGPAGLVIEGVYTFPEARGKSHAGALVAAAALAFRGSMACLHVSANNVPARRAYERAGLLQERSCRLLLCN